MWFNSKRVYFSGRHGNRRTICTCWEPLNPVTLEGGVGFNGRRFVAAAMLRCLSDDDDDDDDASQPHPFITFGESK